MVSPARVHGSERRHVHDADFVRLDACERTLV